MTRFLGGLFSIKPSEWEAVWYFFFVLLVFAFGSSIARSISMTLLIEHLGGDVLPHIFILVDVSAMVSLIIYARYTKRMSGLRILAFFLLIGIVFSIASTFLFLLPFNWVYGLFFVGFFLIYVLISIHIGSVVAAYFTTIQLKRVTGIISAGLPIGGAMGGGALVLLLEIVNDPRWLVLLMSFSYGIAYFLLQGIHRHLSPIRSGYKTSIREKSSLQELKSAFLYIWHSKLMLYMALGMMLFVISSKFLEYQYQALIYPEIFPEIKERVAFFAVYEIFGNLIWLVLQLFLTSRLLTTLGVGASNLLHPILSAIVAVGLYVNFGFISGVLANFVNQEMRGALRTPAGNMLFNAIPPNMWGTTKAFLNGIAFPLATVIASVSLIILKEALDPESLRTILPLVVLILSLLAILVTFPQWAAYNEGMFGLLNRRLFSRKAQMGKIDQLKQMIETKLESQDTQEVIAALEMVRVVKLSHFDHHIGRLLRWHDDPEIKRCCINTLSDLPAAESIRIHLINGLKTEHDPKTLGLLLKTLRKTQLLPNEISRIERFLLHPHPLVFTETCLCLYFNECYDRKSALVNGLLNRLKNPDLPYFSLYLEALGHLKRAEHSYLVVPFLTHNNLHIRLAAFNAHVEMLEGQLDPFVQSFIDILDSDSKEMKIAALKALKESNPPADWTPIIRMLGAKERALVNESKELLRLSLHVCKPDLEKRLFEEKITVDERFEILSLIYPLLTAEQCEQLQILGDKALQNFIYTLSLLMVHQRHEDSNPINDLVNKILFEIADEYLHTVLTLITFLSSETPEFYQRISRNLHSDRANQGNALEVLSNVTEKHLVGRLMRYYEERPQTIGHIDRIYQDLFSKELGLNKNNYAQALMDVEHHLLKACLYFKDTKSVNHFQLLYEESPQTCEFLGIVN